MKVPVVALVLFVSILACNDRIETTDRLPPAAVDDDSQWLVDVTAESGIDFSHVAGARGDLNLPEIMGGGVALLDVDGDGDLDVYLTNQNWQFDPDGDHEQPRNQLYIQGSDGRFTDATDESGLGDTGFGQGVAVGDVDNDGDLDLYLSNFGPDGLYLNRGNGTFEDASSGLGADTSGWSCSVAFFDYDRDGLLDILVTQYVIYDGKRCFDHTGRQQYCGPASYHPAPDLLLHNEGDGRFSDVSLASGIGAVSAAGLGVVSEDFNEDGWPDLYVANDGYANHLWINLGDGTFRDDALVLGVAYNIHGRAEAGMGVVTGDMDGDGRADIFVTHLRQETNTFYRSEGDMGFSDATGRATLAAVGKSLTSFGTAAFDLELDGDLDLFIVNGRVLEGKPLPGARMGLPWSMYAEPNLVLRNDGETFTSLSASVGQFVETVENSRGLAVGDLDGDGDIDLLVGNINGPARIYRNDTPRVGNWLSVRALDPRLKRDAIGARLTVRIGSRSFTRTIASAHSYASAGDLRAHFGLGIAESIDAIDVIWPDGLEERFIDANVDQELTIVRGTGQPLPLEIEP